jgi:hypothetical protein
MSDLESRPPTSSGMGCAVWFGAVVAYPLVAMVLIDKLMPSGPIILLAIPLGLILILVTSTVLARALQIDPDRSPVGLALGLFFGGIFLSAAVFFFGCSMAFKGI